MTLQDIIIGDVFILKRDGNKYKKVSYKNAHRIFVQPLSHTPAFTPSCGCSLNRQCEVIKSL